MVPLLPPVGQTRPVVTTYSSQADGLKSDLTKTSRYDISTESSSLNQDGMAYFAAEMKTVFNSAFISHLLVC